MAKDKKKFGIFSFPISLNPISLNPISQLVDILKSLKGEIHLITGNNALDYFSKDRNVIVDVLHYSKEKNIFLRILKYILAQLILSIKILTHSKNVDIWFSIFGSEQIFPTISAKLSGKRIVQITAASASKIGKSEGDKFSFIIQILNTITNIFSDYIIVYSPFIIEEFGLESFRKKIIIAPRHFVDLKRFFMDQPIAERDNIIGFIGRLSKEKGILNFLNAISLLSVYKDFKYLIIGDGDYKSKVVKFIKNNEKENRIQFLGWINYDSLNNYMNILKLLVIPSYTEGLPNVMLEAMAAGTPVLVSRVGAIPDIITDGVNGFILENNDPKTISDQIDKIMKRNDLNSISKQGIRFIKNNFTFRKAQKRYKTIIDHINNKTK